MIDVLRYLMILTGCLVWLALVFFLTVGSLAYYRQTREDRAFDAAYYDRLREPNMGRLGAEVKR